MHSYLINWESISMYLRNSLIIFGFGILMLLFANCNGNEPNHQPKINHPPIISSLEIIPKDSITVKDYVVLIAHYSDDDKDSLTTYWFAPHGTFKDKKTTDSTDTITWIPSATTGRFKLMISVSDSDTTVNRDTFINVTITSIPTPILTVFPLQLDFGSHLDTLWLTLNNSGNAYSRVFKLLDTQLMFI